MKKFNYLLIGLMLVFSCNALIAQEFDRAEVDVPKVDHSAITLDGMMNEAEWNDAVQIDLVSNSGYNIWANKYYREDLVEPEFDEYYAKLLWSPETLFVFVHIDEFVNDSTDLFFNGKWAGDQLFLSLSARLGLDMMGWYDGNSYAAPEGPYHFWVYGDEVTLNGQDTMYVPEEYRKCFADSNMVFYADDYADWGINIDETNGVWDVEIAIHNPHVTAQSGIAFNLGGSMGSTMAFDQFEDAYAYYTWQPNVPNDPYAMPPSAEFDDPGFYNLASSSHWAMLNFLPGTEDVMRAEMEVPATTEEFVIDGVMEGAWDNAATINLMTGEGYNIWANKYYREDLVEPEFDEYYAKLSWRQDTLFLFVHIDEFVNDSTDLFWDGPWVGDQLFVSISNRLGMDMMGWYDGNSYAAPDGPYHFWVLDDVTLNNGDTTYVPEEFRGCPGDSLMQFDPANYSRYAIQTDPATGVWDVEMAIYNPNVASQAKLGFNLGGSMGSSTAFDQYGDAYGYYTWQPNVPNDPYAMPPEAEFDDPGYYNLASSSRWAVIEFTGKTLVGVEEEPVGDVVPGNFTLMQNYPNPFNPTTKISFTLNNRSNVSLKIYNILGEAVTELLSNRDMSAGSYTVNFNAANLASGVYFYELKAGDFSAVKKMILLK